jgi:hypothetical protein
MSVRKARKNIATASHLYSHLVGYKKWADRGLYDVIARSVDRLGPEDAVILVRLLDHAGIVLQKNGINPNDDRMTDFLIATSNGDGASIAMLDQGPAA